MDNDGRNKYHTMSEKRRRIPELYSLEHRHDSRTEDANAPSYRSWLSPVVTKNDTNSGFVDELDKLAGLDASECATVRNYFNRTVGKDWGGHSN